MYAKFRILLIVSATIVLCLISHNCPAVSVIDPNKRRVDLPVPTPPEVIEVDNAKQLFADDWVIDKMSGLKRTLHQVRKHPNNPLFKPDMPWEKPAVLLFGTVMYDPARDADKFRMWYLCFTPKYEPGYSKLIRKEGRIAYAISRDGINWDRPKLGIHKWNHSDQNNIVIVGAPDSTCVIYDPRDPDPKRRYKAQIRNGGHRGYFSPDGIHWTEFGHLRGFDGYDRSTVHWNPVEKIWFASTKSPCQLTPGAEPWRGRGYQESKNFTDWSPVAFMCATWEGSIERVYNLEPFYYESLFLGIWGRYIHAPQVFHRRATGRKPQRQELAATVSRRLDSAYAVAGGFSIKEEAAL